MVESRPGRQVVREAPKAVLYLRPHREGAVDAVGPVSGSLVLVATDAHDAGETPVPSFRLLPELLLEPSLPPRVGLPCAGLERLRDLLDDRIGLLGAQFEPAAVRGHARKPYPGMRVPRMGDSDHHKGFHPFG